MIHDSRRWRMATALLFGMIVGACGSGGSPSPTTTTSAPSSAATTAAATATTAPIASAVPTIRPTTASASCPTAATVGGALGVTLANPVSIAGGGGAPLPGGATAVACEYAGKSLNVIIELLANVSPSYIDNFSSKYPVPYANVSGVGDQARSFVQSLGGGKDNEGVVATKGSTLVAITATATPASLAQLEALVKQLL